MRRSSAGRLKKRNGDGGSGMKLEGILYSKRAWSCCRSNRDGDSDRVSNAPTLLAVSDAEDCGVFDGTDASTLVNLRETRRSCNQCESVMLFDPALEGKKNGRRDKTTIQLPFRFCKFSLLVSNITAGWAVYPSSHAHGVLVK